MVTVGKVDEKSSLLRRLQKSKSALSDEFSQTSLQHGHQERSDGVSPRHLDHKVKYNKSFLVRFLPSSYYILYVLLTSMQELPMASIQFILSNETQFSPAELTAYYNLCFIPWIIKPLWGFIADNIPICGYRRKPYLIFFAFLSSAVFVLMSFFCQLKPWMRVFGVLQAWCIAFSEVQVDGLVIALANALVRYQTALFIRYPEFKPKATLKEASTGLPPEAIDTDAIFEANPHYIEEITPTEFDLLVTTAPKASIQSEAMTIRTTASLLSSLVSILLHLFLSPRRVVFVAAALPIIIVMCTSLIPENYDSFLPTTLQSKHATDLEAELKQAEAQQKEDAQEKVNQEDAENQKSCGQAFVERVFAILRATRILWKPLLFMLVIRSMPTPTDPLMSYIFGELNLPPWLLSGYSFISVGAGLLATLIYWKWFTRFSVIISFVVFTVLAAIATLPTACLTAHCNTSWFHLPDWAMVFATSALSSFVGRFALMPSLVLAAETVPPKLKLEATMFSIYTAMNNLGNNISFALTMSMIHYFNITYDDYSRLHEMVIVCAVCSLFPLIFVPLIYCTQKEIKQQELEIAQEDLLKLEQQKFTENPAPSTTQHTNAHSNDVLFLYMNENSGQIQLHDPHHAPPPESAP